MKNQFIIIGCYDDVDNAPEPFFVDSFKTLSDAQTHLTQTLSNRKIYEKSEIHQSHGWGKAPYRESYTNLRIIEIEPKTPTLKPGTKLVHKLSISRFIENADYRELLSTHAELPIFMMANVEDVRNIHRVSNNDIDAIIHKSKSNQFEIDGYVIKSDKVYSIRISLDLQMIVINVQTKLADVKYEDVVHGIDAKLIRAMLQTCDIPIDDVLNGAGIDKMIFMSGKKQISEIKFEGDTKQC